MDWRDERCEDQYRVQPRFGKTVWRWILEKAKLTRDAPGKVVRKIVEREFEAEGGGD